MEQAEKEIEKEKKVEEDAGRVKVERMGDKNVDTCPCCTTVITENTQALSCGHRIHLSCWNKYTEKSDKLNTCPICRSAVSWIDTHVGKYDLQNPEMSHPHVYIIYCMFHLSLSLSVCVCLCICLFTLMRVHVRSACERDRQSGQYTIDCDVSDANTPHTGVSLNKIINLTEAVTTVALHRFLKDLKLEELTKVLLCHGRLLCCKVCFFLYVYLCICLYCVYVYLCV